MTDIDQPNDHSASSNQIINGFRYRPDIDGLRAIAVLAVVLFHAGLGFPGGYVGVDVFFVISGFLITSLIIKDLEQGKFSLVSFWERRMRRIWPPLVVVVAATLAAGWFLLLPDDYAELGRSSIWQTLLSANVYFWQDSGYFAGAADEKPLLHTWSLAVEEQFYLVLPLVLMGVAWSGKLRRRTLTALFSFVVVGGLAVSGYGAFHHPSATFFLLPTRAWELAVGSLLAVMPSDPKLGYRSRDVVSIFGLLGVLVPCFLYDKNTVFPGMAAAPPCFGTAALIWANRTPNSQPQGRIAGLLSTPSVVFVGLISYSLYLWHWPIFAFTHYWNFGELTLHTSLACVAASFVLAIASFYLIESPTRKKKVLANRGPVFSAALASSILMLAASWAIDSRNGYPDRLPAQARAVLAKASARTLNRQSMQAEGASKHPTSIQDIEAGTLPTLGKDQTRPSFILWGDSHAKVAMPAFDAFAKQHGLSGRAAILYSTAPFVNFDSGLPNGEPNVIEYSERLLQMIREQNVKDVYLSAYWSLYVEIMGEEKFREIFRETVDRIAATGATVWILMDVPTHQIDVPKAMVGTHMLPFLDWRIEGCTYEEHHQKNSVIFELARQNSSANFIDPAPGLMNKATARYDVICEASPLYYDDNHLTAAGSLKVITPALFAISPLGQLGQQQ